MSEKEKMQKKELEQVSGGGRALDNFPKKKRKCRMCGKEFEVAVMAMGMSMVGSEGRRYQYYHDLCGDCAKEHPYKDPFEQLGVKSSQIPKRLVKNKQ